MFFQTSPPLRGGEVKKSCEADFLTGVVSQTSGFQISTHNIFYQGEIEFYNGITNKSYNETLQKRYPYLIDHKIYENTGHNIHYQRQVKFIEDLTTFLKKVKTYNHLK